MSPASVTLRRADESDLQYVGSLLEANDLPAADVRSKPDCFHVGYDGEARVGIGGVETDGTDGLLRSVVVERSARGSGVGTALCRALEARARDDGVERLYLLTTTAAEFFDRLGYERIQRADAPDAIRETSEFADLCPSTATCMGKSL